MKNPLEMTWLMILAAVILALFLPGPSIFLKQSVLYLLIFIMSISIRKIRIADFISNELVAKGIVLSLVNIFALGGLILLLAMIIPVEKEYMNGLILMALVPCAVAVIPYSKLLGGDVKCATFGLIVNYLLSLIITPLLIWLFFRQGIDLIEMLKVVIQFILVPLAISRFISESRFLDHHESSIINLLFFVVIYALVGINAEQIMAHFLDMKGLMAILALRTFAISSLMIIVAKLLKIGPGFGIPLAVFSGYKNLGYSAVLALALFGDKTALPSTLGVIFETLLFIFLDWIFGALNYRKHAEKNSKVFFQV